MNDRRDGVEEGEGIFAGQRADRVGKRGRGRGSGRDNDAVPVRRRQRRLPRADRRSGMTESPRSPRRKSRRDRPRARRRPAPGARRRAHDQRIQPPHLLVQQADRVAVRRRSERNWSRPARQAVGLVRVGRRTGRISWRTTGTPCRAICQAASEPARPPPMTWTGFQGHAPETRRRRLRLRPTMRGNENARDGRGRFSNPVERQLSADAWRSRPPAEFRSG